MIKELIELLVMITKTSKDAETQKKALRLIVELKQKQLKQAV